MVATGIEGKKIWDTINRVKPDKNGNVPHDKMGSDFGDYTDKRYSLNPAATFDDANSATGVLSQTITSSDGPGSGPPLSTLGYENQVTSLQSIQLVWNFTIYVTATAALDKVNVKQKPTNSDMYAAEASADWSFTGSGSVSNGKWQGAANGVMKPDAWKPADSTTSSQIVIGQSRDDRVNPYLVAWNRLGWKTVETPI